MAIKVGKREKVSGNGSDRKSFKLVFWLFVAKIALILLLAGFAVWLIYVVKQAVTGDNSGLHFKHITGSGYTQNGKLWVASDSGLAGYHDGKWSRSSENKTKGAFFLPVDNGYFRITGKTIEYIADGKVITKNELPAGLGKGVWAAGYKSHAISHLSRDQLSISVDSGNSWEDQQLEGIKGNPQQLAIDPGNDRNFAVATDRGLYLTSDGGKTGIAMLKGENVTSVSYGFNSRQTLLAGTSGDETALYSIIPDEDKAIHLDIGSVESDRLIQIKQNPVRHQEAVLITAGGNIYMTENGGQNWVIIAQNGRALSLH